MTTKETGVRIEKLPPILTVSRAADVAGVSRRTVRRWVLTGKLKASRIEQSGTSAIRIETRTLLRLLGIPVSDA